MRCGYYFVHAKPRAVRRGVVCGHRVTIRQAIALHQGRWICGDCALSALSKGERI